MDGNVMKVPSQTNSMGKISPSPDIIPHTVVCEEKYFEEKYETKTKLGEGSFGVVYEALNKETGERCACKIILKDKAGGHRFQLVSREVTFLKKVQHEHIIRLKEVIEMQQKIFLVMELCERGELSKLVQSRCTLSEMETRIVMQRLVSAICYLHKLGLVHRDLKLENILLSKNPNDDDDEFYIKVTDFGLSIRKAGNTADDMMDDFCGTLMYMAPEILDNKTYSEKCDVWAMGIIMCILLTGVPPFHDGSNLKEVDIKTKLKQTQWKNISVEAKDCIERMLILDPAPRMTALELFDHPWINNRPLLQIQGQRNVLEMMKEYMKENEIVQESVFAKCEKSQKATCKGSSGQHGRKAKVTSSYSADSIETSSSTMKHSKFIAAATSPIHNLPITTTVLRVSHSSSCLQTSPCVGLKPSLCSKITSTDASASHLKSCMPVESNRVSTAKSSTKLLTCATSKKSAKTVGYSVNS